MGISSIIGINLLCTKLHKQPRLTASYCIILTDIRHYGIMRFCLQIKHTLLKESLLIQSKKVIRLLEYILLLIGISYIKQHLRHSFTSITYGWSAYNLCFLVKYCFRNLADYIAFVLLRIQKIR